MLALPPASTPSTPILGVSTEQSAHLQVVQQRPQQVGRHGQHHQVPERGVVPLLHGSRAGLLVVLAHVHVGVPALRVGHAGWEPVQEQARDLQSMQKRGHLQDGAELHPCLEDRSHCWEPLKDVHVQGKQGSQHRLLAMPAMHMTRLQICAGHLQGGEGAPVGAPLKSPVYITVYGRLADADNA